eukprot:9762794-Ditylum_brightwellii.AAC.1
MEDFDYKIIANDLSMSIGANGLTQGVPQSIGPDGQQHHKNGVNKQERAFERMKMAPQEDI